MGPQFPRMFLSAVALALLASVSAQDSDTYHCPDGWFWHEGHGGRGHCYFFSMEQLSKENAGILCASHGGWIVEIPHPPVNYWIKAKLLDLYTPDKQEKARVPWGTLFWMGAVTEDRHDDHVNGNWWWPHANVYDIKSHHQCNQAGLPSTLRQISSSQSSTSANTFDSIYNASVQWFPRTELHDLHGVQGCNLPELPRLLLERLRLQERCRTLSVLRTVLTAPSREQLPQSSFHRKNSLVL